MMFTDWFGGAPHARVFDFLAQAPEHDHTITNIARETEVSRPTVYKVVDDFQEHGLIEQTRTVGNSRFFQLDHDNQTVRDLLRALKPSPFEVPEEDFPDFELQAPGGPERSKHRGKRRKR